MIKAVLFDLDGVLVFTDELHFQVWREMAANLGVQFTEEQANRCRGLSRMDSLEIVLEKSERKFSQAEKEELARQKNEGYCRLLDKLTPDEIPFETRDTLAKLRERGIKLAVASSSRNARLILQKIGLTDMFDAIVDGNDISRSKPDPEVFALAAKAVGELPENCLAVDDAESGIASARGAGTVAVGIGNSAERKLGEYNIDSIKDLLNLI